ncbi:MAG TPA: hypothetical protein PKK18_12585 [Chitinophagales bacterium]|nr:hypothetical protein [Chitinophagales bacterium]
MKNTTLLVFVLSPNIPPYINSITHAVKHHGVNKIIFLNINNAPVGETHDFPRFMRQFSEIVNGLANNTFEGEKIDIGTFDGYTLLKSVFTTYKIERDVSYDFLKSNISGIIKEYGDDCFLDLTGVPKRLAFDIFIACSYLGLERMIIFELKTNKRNAAALYHNLQPTEFEYVFLPKSEEFVSSIEAISSKKNFNKLMIVISAIILSSIIAWINYYYKNKNSDTWIFLILTQVFAIFGGILPILDAWGGIKLKRR